MMWVLAAVVVVVLALAAVVGTGRWGAMPELVDDRPSTLPAAGPVTADDLRRTRFSVVTRGYSMAQVDALLARVAAQLDEARDAAPAIGQEPAYDFGPGREPFADKD